MTKINNDAPISINVEIPERVRSLLSDERFVVILLLMIGLVMRIFNISYQSIGLDEGSTFWYSHYTWSEFFDANEPNSPVYYIMEGYILDALGQNEFALRISSAISGALCVPLTYYLIKKVTGVYPVAVFAAVLIMVSPSCLYYSQEARGYSLVMFFFLLQALMILRGMETGKIVYWIMFAVFAGMSFAMQFVGMIGTFTLYCYALYYYWGDIKARNFRNMKGIIITTLLFVIIAIPLLGFAFDSFLLRSQDRSIWCFIGPIYLADFVYQMFFRSIVFGIVILALVLLGAKTCIENGQKGTSFLLIVALVPLMVTYLLSFISNVTPRYIFWALPAFYALAACCILKDGPDREAMKGYIKKGAVILLVACLICLPYYYIHICKEDFRGGCEVLEEIVQPGDAVIYVPDGWNSVRPCMMFYMDFDATGASFFGADTQEQIEAIWNDPAYGNVYILVYDEQEPYEWIASLPESQCKHIYHAYWMDVYQLM